VLAVELDAVRLAEGRGARGAAIPEVTLRSRTRHGGDDPSAPIHPADEIILHLNKIKVARSIEADLVGLVEFGGEGRSAIARVSARSLAGHRVNGAVGEDLAHGVAVHVADVKRAIGSARDAIRIVELGATGGATVARATGRASSGQGLDARSGGGC